MDLIDVAGGGRGAVAVAAVGVAGLAPGASGLGVGWPLGERGGLALGLAARLLELLAGLAELALEALGVEAEAFVLQAQLVEGGAEGGELREDGGERLGLISGLVAAIMASAGRGRLAPTLRIEASGGKGR